MGELALLWHMHQPDYRDPHSHRPVLPWVRLHALRGYRDVCLDVLRDGAAATINVVPSLLDQLDHYAKGGDDPHLALTEMPADTLSSVDRDAIRRTFVCGNPTMIACQPAYKALAARVAGPHPLSKADWRDLQVWSTLAWFGSTATRDFPELVALRQKGRGFSEDDKRVMLAAQRAITGEFPELFAKIGRSGHAALSASPYFHPILPLLVDTGSAKRNLPGVEDVGFRCPADALLQLTRTRDRLTTLVGTAPKGLWPSEGSVSPEILPLVAHAGFRWLCTDDAVLARSDGENAARPGPWELGNGVVGFFRDHGLSDLIGFDAARLPADRAVGSILHAVQERARDGIVTIALDGENPWEAFADAGDEFRRTLHAALSRGNVRGITLDAASERPPVGKITRLHTGSWINANFGIWYGDADDRKAWRLLQHARDAVAKAPPALAEAALEKLLPAEGSDWFWWYGPEFSTPFAADFDALFRAHVRAAWETLGEPVPDELNHPVSERITGAAGAAMSLPTALIDPTLSPTASWLRWRGAGSLRLGRGSSMARAELPIGDISWGWARDGALWLRADVTGDEWTVSAGKAVATDATGDAAVVVADGSLVARFAAGVLPQDRVPVSFSNGLTWPESGVVQFPRLKNPRLSLWSA